MLQVKVQLLQRRLLQDEGAFAASWNWIDAFLKAEHGVASPDHYLMLRQALMARRVVLLLDGIDEGGVARERIERHVADVLLPQGFTMLCTSRPSGLNEARFVRFQRLKLSPLADAQQEQVVKRRLGAEGAAPLLAYLRDKVPLDTESGVRVTANPLMLAMIISVFEMRKGAAEGGMPESIASLYGVAISAMLERAGSDLASHVQRLLQATLFEAHAAQQRVIELHHLEAAALGLTDAPKLAMIRDEWPSFAGPPQDGHVVKLKSGGARGTCIASGTAFKVAFAEGSQTSILTKNEIISSGLDAHAFGNAQRHAVRAALDALASDAQVRSAMALVIDRVGGDRLPLLSLLQTEPLQMQSSHLSFQEYFAAFAGLGTDATSIAPVAHPLFGSRSYSPVLQRLQSAVARRCRQGRSRGGGAPGGPTRFGSERKWAPSLILVSRLPPELRAARRSSTSRRSLAATSPRRSRRWLPFCGATRGFAVPTFRRTGEAPHRSHIHIRDHTSRRTLDPLDVPRSTFPF